jgi:hypothetical protein
MRVDWRALRAQAVDLEAAPARLRAMEQAEWDLLPPERQWDLLRRFAPKEYRKARRRLWVEAILAGIAAALSPPPRVPTHSSRQ